MEIKMVTKIKLLSLASIMALSCQITVFACMDPQKTAEELFEEFNDEFTKYGRPQYKIFIKLHKLFETKNQATIRKEFAEKILSLKTKDTNKEIISDKDIYEAQKIWDQFKSVYNYDLLDFIMYPLHQPANKKNLEELKKEYTKKQDFAGKPKEYETKPLVLDIYPDKYAMSENKEKMKILFQYMNDDTARPKKPMDFGIRPILEIVLSTPGIIVFHTKANIVRTACSLPSLLLPRYFFKDKKISDDTRKTNIEINEYNNAIVQHESAINKYVNVIKQHDNAIKKQDNAIKRKNLAISIKQQQARDAFDVLFPKKNFSN